MYLAFSYGHKIENTAGFHIQVRFIVCTVTVLKWCGQGLCDAASCNEPKNTDALKWGKITMQH